MKNTLGSSTLVPSQQGKKWLGQVSDAIRAKHYFYRT